MKAARDHAEWSPAGSSRLDPEDPVGAQDPQAVAP
jgi:hypothetical protein